ncbi:MAG: UDP-2,3-diacylglucosamine diphosphatase [Bacteroidetes bacterium]|nr:UDP-2,3-diacylglucosamine diphosphatase [Bacteroidota bacterium]
MNELKKPIYFFSDAHIGLNDENSNNQFPLYNFLDHVLTNASELFIVGDLFDFWFEYKNAIPSCYNKVLYHLNKITNSGIPVHFIVGNHDCWVKDYFTNQIGINVYKEPITITRNEKSIHLHHGDGLALRDAGYKIMRSILRSKLFIFLYSLLPINIGFAIGKKLSRKSRHNHKEDKNGEEQGMINYAELKLNNGCDVVIMGHHHKYLYKEFDNGIYINLGDWLNENSYATFDGNKFELKFWK